MRGDPFHSLEMELPEFTAVLDEMTKNTYVLVIVHDVRIGALYLVLDCFVQSAVIFFLSLRLVWLARGCRDWISL